MADLTFTVTLNDEAQAAIISQRKVLVQGQVFTDNEAQIKATFAAFSTAAVKQARTAVAQAGVVTGITIS